MFKEYAKVVDVEKLEGIISCLPTMEHIEALDAKFINPLY